MIANLATDPPTLDWSLATDHVSFNVIANLMVGLAEAGEGGLPRPLLAGSWDVEDEGRRYVFHLREDARWTDGKPVTAGDFVYSWRRILSPKTASEYAYLLFPLKNGRAVSEGRLPPDRLGVRAEGPWTLVAELERPAAFFLNLVTFEITYPQREDVVERWGEAWTDPAHIVTNGPYRLAQWRHQDRILLKANPDYFLGKPAVEKVELLMLPDRITSMTLFDRGRLDVMDNHSLDPLDIPRYEKRPRFRRVPQLRGYYWGFNVEAAPFADSRVRRAFAHAVDRSAFPKILRGGERPATSWVPPGMFCHNPALGLAFAPEKAQALLAEAGYPGGRGFPPVTAWFNTDETHELVAQALQAQWRENLHLEIRIRNVEWKAYLDQLQRDPPPLYRMGWGADYPDPDNFLNLFASYSGNNYSRWKNPAYDALVEKAAGELDPAARQALCDQAQRLLLEEDAVLIPLFTTTENILSQPWVEGFSLDAMARLRLAPIHLLKERLP